MDEGKEQAIIKDEDREQTIIMDRLHKTTKLLDEIYKPLNVFNRADILVKFCVVLRRQQSLGLTRISDDILKHLSSEYIDCISYIVSVYLSI